MTQSLHDYPDWQGSLNTADLDVTAQSVVLGVGSAVSLAPQDMRNYSSFSVHVRVSQAGAATAYNGCAVSLLWAANNAGARRPYREVYGIWAEDNGAGAFACLLGDMYLNDSVKGSWLTVAVDNYGADVLACTIDLAGNSRSQGRRYLTNPHNSIALIDVFANSSLINANNVALAAGATATYLVPLSPGLARVRMVAITTTHFFSFFDIMGRDLGSWVGVAGSDFHEFVALPHSAVKMVVTNNGAVAGNHYVNLVTARDNW